MPLSPQKSKFFGAPSSAAAFSHSEGKMGPGTLGDRKHRTNLKAELVRQELLSRGDFIKLY
jgi:hypothetical protein